MTARRFRRCRGALRRPIARPLRQADHDPRRPANRVTLSVVALTLMLAAPVAAPLAAQQDTTIHVLTLGGAARLASRQSATVLAARAEADQASARVHESFSSFLPNVYGGASEREFTENSASLLRFPPSPGSAAFNSLLPPGGIVFPPIKSVDFRGYASDTLFSYGAIQRYRQTRISERASEAGADNAAEQAAGAAAGAYLTAQRADAVLAARLADSSLAADLLNIARQQLSAGVSIALDVTRAAARLTASRAQVIAARSDRDRSRLDLYRALGLPLDTRLSLTDSLAHLPVSDSLPPEAQEIDRALRHRPDLHAIDEQLSAAEQAISAVRAERLPALAVFGDKGVNGGNWSRLLPTYTWGIGLAVPVFDGAHREARIEEQQALTQEILVRRRDLRQVAAIEVRGAFLQLASAREQLDASTEQLQLTQQELSEARERFRAGVAGDADVITASLDLNGARTLQVDALTNYQAARVALALATGSVTELP
jgi:outer membrane protein TolC